MYDINKALKAYDEAYTAYGRTPEGEAADDLWTTVTTIAVEIVNELAKMESPQVIEGAITVEVSGGRVQAVFDDNYTHLTAKVYDYDTDGADEDLVETADNNERYIHYTL